LNWLDSGADFEKMLLESITSAPTLEVLKSNANAAWGMINDADQKAKIKEAHDKRKSELESTQQTTEQE